MDRPEEGATRTVERTFAAADVRRFGELSGDEGRHHVEPDPEGRLMVQGLLTATLPTKIGGDMNFIARTMEFEFVRPVRTDETISCEWTTETVVECDDRFDVAGTAVCTNETGKVVLRAAIDGLIRR